VASDGVGRESPDEERVTTGLLEGRFSGVPRMDEIYDVRLFWVRATKFCVLHGGSSQRRRGWSDATSGGARVLRTLDGFLLSSLGCLVLGIEALGHGLGMPLRKRTRSPATREILRSVWTTHRRPEDRR
jgi:hypothetical protein